VPTFFRFSAARRGVYGLSRKPQTTGERELAGQGAMTPHGAEVLAAYHALLLLGHGRSPFFDPPPIANWWGKLWLAEERDELP
jgi:hypothetical protein